MTEVSFPNSPLRLEKSSLSPSAHVDGPKTIQTHFETSSLAPSSKIETTNASIPQLPSSYSPNKSYQILLVEHAQKLSDLQGRLLKFDTQQIEKIAEKTKTVFSKLLEVNEHARAREINAKNWQRVAQVMSGVVAMAAIFTFSLPAVVPTVAALAPLLQANYKAQEYVNSAYLLKTKAEMNDLNHSLKKGQHEQKRLTQNSSNNAFTVLEEQIHLLAETLEKQIIDF
ncbi:MAG: hypothetical protein ACRCU0_04730 [Candidatus Rhabdochlamydia sp.]